MSLTDIPRVARELAIGSELGQGATGREARRLQELICLAGDRLGCDGEFGPATAAALRRTQARLKLTVTGTSTRETWAALTSGLRLAFSFATETTTLREAVLLTARRHLLYLPREVGGANRGPWVRAYCGADGAAFAWCAGFATTLVQQAAAMRAEPVLLPWLLGCDEMSAAARKANRLTSDPRHVRPGDLALLRNPRNPADRFHTFVIEAMHADHLESIEGNTNDDGSRDGYEACRRTRALGPLVEYILLG